MDPLIHPHYSIQTINHLYDRFTDVILTLGSFEMKTCLVNLNKVEFPCWSRRLFWTYTCKIKNAQNTDIHDFCSRNKNKIDVQIRNGGRKQYIDYIYMHRLAFL